MRKNRKKVYVRPTTPHDVAKAAWREFEYSLYLVLVAAGVCGLAVTSWYCVDNFDLWCVVGWALGIGSPTMQFAIWTVWGAIDSYLDWSKAQDAVFAIPRNRRVNKQIGWFDWGGWA